MKEKSDVQPARSRRGAGGRRGAWVVLCIVAWMSSGCRAAADPALDFDDARAWPVAAEARSPNGMVVTGSPIASRVGAHVLAQGGNAVDAAVATAFVLSVVEPTMSGIGGRTQILIRRHDGEYAGIDGTTQVPPSYAVEPPLSDDGAYGYETVAIPGTVAALSRALEEHGTWSWARVLAPAIELAERGFVLPPEEAARIASAAERLAEFDAASRYFLKPEGGTWQAGERFVQRDLAATLRRLAEHGADDFYRGEIARRIAADVSAADGAMTEEDLAQYRAEDAIVVRGRYRGRDLVGTYLPASGATTIQVLQMAEHFDLPRVAGTSDWIAVLVQALLIGFADRAADLGAPAEKAALITSAEWAARRAAEIRSPIALHAGDDASLTFVAGADEPEHTTHLSVVDAHGGVVSLTQSVGPNLGAIAAADGLGFVYAATMGYLGAQRAGARPMSSQSPLIVEEDGQPLLVVGGAGARRIIPAIVAVLSRVLDGDEPFADAMHAPRFHAPANRIDVEVRPGTSWADTTIARLRELGFTVEARSEAPYFARINGIAWDAARGEYVGVADPRWHGGAVAPREAGAAAPR
jgi:gamma-glutamyltranspeptidase / glutathione hydrolase